MPTEGRQVTRGISVLHLGLGAQNERPAELEKAEAIESGDSPREPKGPSSFCLEGIALG